MLTEVARDDPQLRGEARQLYRALYGEPMPESGEQLEPVPPPPSSVPQRRRDRRRARESFGPAPDRLRTPRRKPDAKGDPTRVITVPSAFRRPSGQTGINVFQLSSFDFDWGVTDELELGLQTTIPAGALSLGGNARYGTDFGAGAVALQVQAFGAMSLVGEREAFGLIGAGPVITLGNRDRFITAGLGGYALKVPNELFGAMVATAGGSVALGGHVRLNAELWVPLVVEKGERLYRNTMLVLYGVRIFGRRFWGDISLIAPICPGCDGVYDVSPIGLPFLGFGLQF